MGEPRRLLVVDDNPEIGKLIDEYMSGEGFHVSVAGDGDEMRRVLGASAVDLVILDLNLPGEDGLSLARYMQRQYPDVAIIMLTGRRDEVDRIVGLELGADDYIVKPFRLRELLARVRSVLRRTGRHDGTARGEVARFAGWLMRPTERHLTSPDGREVAVTTAEFDLLSTLLSYPKRVLSREELLELARRRPASPDDRSVDVLIGRLRRKIEADPQHPHLIKTVRGAGYILAADVEWTAPPDHA